ncbi:hypothetical protein NSMS1_36570 [Nostoc sp. MS1]|nr:hypothetical protein NSMS1_36570 [Nostoc sp. MS1]
MANPEEIRINATQVSAKIVEIVGIAIAIIPKTTKRTPITSDPLIFLLMSLETLAVIQILPYALANLRLG